MESLWAEIKSGRFAADFERDRVNSFAELKSGMEKYSGTAVDTQI
jgi:hypothetical protein